MSIQDPGVRQFGQGPQEVQHVLVEVDSGPRGEPIQHQIKHRLVLFAGQGHRFRYYRSNPRAATRAETISDRATNALDTGSLRRGT